MALPLIFIFTYTLGCFNSAYYLVEWQAAKNLQTLGSGTLGARNVSRVLGMRWAFIVFLLDALKGALAIWLTLLFTQEALALCVAMLGVILGHIFPVQLRYRGGKGLATLIGILGALQPGATLAGLIAFGLWLRLLKRYNEAVIMGLTVTLSLATLHLTKSTEVYGLYMVSILVLMAHKMTRSSGPA